MLGWPVDRRFLLNLGVCFFGLFAVDLSGNVQGRSGDEELSSSRGLKALLLEQINRDRAANLVPPVKYSEKLSELADQHCREMLLGDFVSHWNQEGWTPYMRYSHAGIVDRTAENITSVRAVQFETSLENVRQEVLDRHRALVSEEPPEDLHRKSILDPTHTHVGIGLAYDATGMRMIELFARHYVDVKVLPLEARLGDELAFEGRVLAEGYEVESISVFYEPFPEKPGFGELNIIRPYEFPRVEGHLRPRLPKYQVIRGQRVQPRYSDGSRGEIKVERDGRFSGQIGFSHNEPGVYTVSVWLRGADENEVAIMVTHQSIFVRR